MEVEKNGLFLQEWDFKVSCVVSEEDAALAPWAGVVEKAAWQLFLSQSISPARSSGFGPTQLPRGSWMSQSLGSTVF